MKDTFLRGAERGEGRGERREKLQRGVKAAQGIVVCLALGGVLSVGVNFRDGIIPSQPSGNELPDGIIPGLPRRVRCWARLDCML